MQVFGRENPADLSQLLAPLLKLLTFPATHQGSRILGEGKQEREVYILEDQRLHHCTLAVRGQISCPFSS